MNNTNTTTNQVPTVKSLRQSGGYKVMVNHHRRYWDQANKRWVCMTDYIRSLTNIPVSDRSQRGGVTEVVVTDVASNKNYRALAECSVKDNYCKRMGVKIALGRVSWFHEKQ